jgi:hypothetical protein
MEFFLLKVMEALGFNNKWIDWIAALLGTASSKVLVNGQPTQEILHSHGLRQGDPPFPAIIRLGN